MELSSILTPENTTALINVVVSFIVTVIGAVLTAIAPKIVAYVRAKATEQQFETLEYIVTQGVRFAEQAYRDHDGEAKFDAAYAFVSAALKARGINVDADELEKVIEAAVLKEFNPPRPAEVTSPEPQEPTAPLAPSRPSSDEVAPAWVEGLPEGEDNE